MPVEPTNLTDSTISDTFNQLLHIPDGPVYDRKPIYSGTGVATTLALGTTSASINGIVFSSTGISMTSGDLNIYAEGDILFQDDVHFANGAQARSALSLGSMATQGADNVTITGGSISGVTFSGSFTGLTLVASTALQGGNLKLLSNELVSTNANGNITINPDGAGEVLFAAKAGYPVGVGGTVTQATNKSTAVTINKVCGNITMHNAELTHGTSVSFNMANSMIDATDTVIVNIASGATVGAYLVIVDSVSAGSCKISVHNLDQSSLSEAIILRFAVLKTAIS